MQCSTGSVPNCINFKTSVDVSGSSTNISISAKKYRPGSAPPACPSKLQVSDRILCPRPNYHKQHSLKGPMKKRKEEDAHAYMKSNVDSLLCNAIEYVLIKQPDCLEDIPVIFLEYFRLLKTANKRDIAVLARSTAQKKRTTGTNRLFIATAIAPILVHLIELALESKPTDIVSFYVCNIEQVVKENEFRACGKSRFTANRILCPGLNTTDISNLNCETSFKTNKTVTNGDMLHTIHQLVILLVGIDGSGKSTLISVLRGSNNPKCKPSLGFRPVSMKYKDIVVKLYDVGGGEKIRGIWDNYYHDVHGIIYVVDSSCCEEKYEETINVAKSTLGHKYLQGKPLLVISNKIDEPITRSIEQVLDDMTLTVKDGGHTGIIWTSLHPQMAKFGGSPDPAIDKGLEWLINTVCADFYELDNRVSLDKQEEEAKNAKEEEKREWDVLKRSICRAFGLDEQDRSGVFDKDEGEEFMAHELDLEDNRYLSQEGKEVAALVGYEKIAMMIVGNMMNPKNKRKRDLSWEDVKKRINLIRKELNI